jgi:parvulin-like peptidyl-prolyl isomerase
MRIIKAFLAGLAVISLGHAAQAAVADRIVAVVNDEVITLSELNRLLEPYKSRLEKAPLGLERDKALADARMDVLNQLVSNLLMEQQARKSGIAVRDAEVTEAIEELLVKRNFSQDELYRMLERDGMTLDAYRKGMRDQLMRIKLLQREIKTKVGVSDEEIGEYYSKHRAVYEGNEAVRIRQILLLLPKSADEDGRARLRAEAEALQRRLADGESFVLLAARHSQGPAASEGGDIGFVERGVILPEVEEVAFSLPMNQVSPLIESPVGFHIIQVTDRRGAGLKAMEAVREEIRARIEQEKLEKKFEEWIVALRKKSHVEIRL